MINKKLLAVASVAAVLSASSAFAKTEGNYVGLDLLATKYKTDDIEGGRKDSTDIGAGLNYKYAFNYNNIFFAPGAFYNFNNAEVKDSEGDKTKLKYSYGVKADLGYDVTDKFAPFVTFGFQQNRHEYSNENATSESLIYGVGAKYSVASNVDVALAYEYVDYRSNIPNSFNPDVVKLGVAYKF